MIRNLVVLCLSCVPFLNANADETSDACKKVAPDLLSHARVDGDYTFAKYDKISQSWVEEYYVDCEFKDENTTVTYWLKPTQSAPNEYAESFDGCAVVYEYKKNKLIKVSPGCA